MGYPVTVKVAEPVALPVGHCAVASIVHVPAFPGVRCSVEVVLPGRTVVSGCPPVMAVHVQMMGPFGTGEMDATKVELW